MGGMEFLDGGAIAVKLQSILFERPVPFLFFMLLCPNSGVSFQQLH